MPSTLKPNTRVRVLGLDPGTRVTGWGLIDVVGGCVAQVRWGVFRSKPQLMRPARLAGLAAKLGQLLEELHPAVVAIETPFVSGYPRASLRLAETRGALLAAVGGYTDAVFEYEPARVKAWVVGSGQAEKRQVAWMVRRFLHLEEELQPDAADALAVAMCHLFEVGALGGAGVTPS
ncbi:MAG: crossover junction endodeoxyribonuclease RuvC [Thermoanaerobaculaceae bacterium]